MVAEEGQVSLMAHMAQVCLEGVGVKSRARTRLDTSTSNDRMSLKLLTSMTHETSPQDV